MEATSSLQPALVVSIFTDGLALSTPPASITNHVEDVKLFTWQSGVAKELAAALEYGIITIGVAKLLQNVSDAYDEGRVRVQVKEYRRDGSWFGRPDAAAPTVFDVVLSPSSEALVHSLESSGEFSECSQIDLLEAERLLLRSIHKVVLNPDPKDLQPVAHAYYNRQKFCDITAADMMTLRERFTFQHKRLRSNDLAHDGSPHPPFKKPRLGVIPFVELVGQPRQGPDFHSFDDEQVILAKQFRDSLPPPPPRHQSDSAPPAFPPAQMEVPPSLSDSYLLPINKQQQNEKTNRMLRFRYSKNHEVLFFEIIPKSNGCFDGRLRVATIPEGGAEGTYSERFSLGSASSALTFIQNLRDLENIVRVTSNRTYLKEAMNYHADAARARAAAASQAQAGGRPGTTGGVPQGNVSSHGPGGAHTSGPHISALTSGGPSRTVASSSAPGQTVNPLRQAGVLSRGAPMRAMTGPVSNPSAASVAATAASGKNSGKRVSGLPPSGKRLAGAPLNSVPVPSAGKQPAKGGKIPMVGGKNVKGKLLPSTLPSSAALLAGSSLSQVPPILPLTPSAPPLTTTVPTSSVSSIASLLPSSKATTSTSAPTTPSTRQQRSTVGKRQPKKKSYGDDFNY